MAATTTLQVHGQPAQRKPPVWIRRGPGTVADGDVVKRLVRNTIRLCLGRYDSNMYQKAQGEAENMKQDKARLVLQWRCLCLDVCSDGI